MLIYYFAKSGEKAGVVNIFRKMRKTNEQMNVSLIFIIYIGTRSNLIYFMLLNDVNIKSIQTHSFSNRHCEKHEENKYFARFKNDKTYQL